MSGGRDYLGGYLGREGLFGDIWGYLGREGLFGGGVIWGGIIRRILGEGLFGDVWGEVIQGDIWGNYFWAASGINSSLTVDTGGGHSHLSILRLKFLNDKHNQNFATKR